MKKNLLSFFLLFSCFSFAFAQTKVITGKVTDQKDGSPLPGVSVIAKGATSVGTQTDINGTYRITVSNAVKTLVFRYVGYKEAELPAAGGVVNVQLEYDPKQLSEVLVVGYGTQKRANVTGSIASVAGKDIEYTPVPTFSEALQGKAAGVVIQANNGKLGQGMTISVRGTSTISGNTQPLVVIDGTVINNSNLSSDDAASDPLADIDFNDIESYEILKDASASAIYGSRASNGVILITTKKGKAGAPKITFNMQFGSSEPSRHRQFLNTTQWLALEERAAVGAAKQDVIYGYEPDLPTAIADEKASLESTFTGLAAGSTDWTKYNTNWEKEAFQSAPQQQYDLSFSGGNDKTTYYIGGQALNETGIIKGNALKRYSGRLNISSKMYSNFEVGMNMDFTHSYNERVANDDQFSTPLQVVALSPITPVIDPRSGLLSGTPPYDFDGNYPLYYNGLINVANAYSHTSIYRTFGNVYANWGIVNHLTFRSEFGVDQTNQVEESYFNSLTAADTGTPNGLGNNNSTTQTHFTVNNFFTYKNVFATNHSLDVTAGTSYEYNNIALNQVQGEQFPSDAYKKIASAAVISAGTSKQTSNSLVSYFARANYSYKGKYLLSASVRDDGSSNFGADHRYAIFPAASVGWIMTQEDFLKNFSSLSNLKLRASYGLTGNDGALPYSALGLFSGDAGYNGAAGQRFYQVANPDLKWESTTQIDLGLDWGFFNNRLSGGFDYYKKNTHDLLLNVNIPETSGIGFQLQNLGKMYNEGIEFQLASDNFVGKFKWSTSFNVAYNKNVVTYIEGQIINDGADLNRVVEGQPIGVFYGAQYAGVDPANGDAIYFKNTKKADGTLDKSVTNDPNQASNVPLGNPTPTWTGGLTNTLSYAGFDLTFTFYGSFGNKIYNGGGVFMSENASNGLDNQTLDQLNYWNKPGDKTNVPEPRLFYGNGSSPSSRWLEDGSYVRLKTLNLGYNIPKKWLAKVKIERMRVFMNTYNLFLITNYKGWDPEVNADYQATNINRGVDFYSAPQPRTITFGVNVGL
jgi:TonB-linked SusC/RagA family outer membrane protein